MAEQLIDLWPDEIVTDVLSPVAIIRFQAEQLRRKTKGLLEAEVQTIDDPKSKNIVLEFEIVVPALDGYAYSLFNATHSTDLVYPVRIEFEPWNDTAKREYGGARNLDGSIYYPIDLNGDKFASTPDELSSLLKQILTSGHTRSVLMSLLARIRDTSTRTTDDSGR